MTVHLGFLPDAARARVIDRRMYSDLAGSLRHVVAACEGQMPFQRSAIRRLADALEAGVRCPPGVFACYYDLVAALMDDDSDAASASFDELALQSTVGVADLAFVPLIEPERCLRSARYHRMLVGDDAALGMQPADKAVAAGFPDRFARAMALMRRAVPELADEVDAIVHEVIPVASDRSRPMQIDGGSHYQLWGALFLNADFHPSDVAMLEVVAHESAHSLLFGLCTDETLVDNDDSELYPSPLRTDLRPMDGIYHATFVSARMHWAMSRLLASGEAGEGSRADIIAARDADRRNFEAGESVVRSHGRLTPLGRELMDGARRYMAAA